MDISLVVIFIAIFPVGCLAVFLMYKYGIRQKSYEEALAEQRQHSQALLSNKVKPKDKKNKKAAKKSKDKDKADEDVLKQGEHKNSESGDGSRPQTPQKHHVEFKQEPEELPPKEQPANKKKIKKDVRPILINKEDVENVVDAGIEDIPLANHFEEIHPKDDFELMRSNSKEDLLKAKEKSKAKHHTDAELPKKKEEAVKQEPCKEKPKSKEQQNTDQNKKKIKVSVSELPPVVEKEKPKDSKPVAVEKESTKEKTVPLEKDKRKDVHEKEKQKDVKPVASEKDKNNEVKPVQSEKDKPKDVKSPVVEKEKPKEVKPPATNVVALQTNGTIGNHGKEKKKKKSDFNSLQQLAVDKEGANMPILLNLVRKAELSRSEVQILIDLLLNKQHEAPVIVEDWSEGKSDPVQKLKRQLAERERALQEEQEAAAGAQAKLREVRAEQLSERAQLQQKLHGLEELLQGKQLELQGLNGRCLAHTQQCQQLQAQLAEERAGMQMQVQQYEMRLAQAQEAEGIIVQLRADAQALSEQNQQMRIELQRLAEEKEHHQGVIIQLNGFQEELKQKTDQIRHLESTLDVARRKDGDYNVEITRLESICQQNLDNIRDLEVAKNHALEEVRNVKNQKEELDSYIGQLKAEVQSLKQDKAQLEERQANGSAEENKSQQVEILNLHNALSSVRNELQQSERRHRAELEGSRGALERLEAELREQRAKNDELRTRNWKVMEALNAAEARIKNHSKAEAGREKSLADVQSQEFEKQKGFILRLFPDITELKSIKATPNEWQAQCATYITEYLASLKREQQTSGPPTPTANDEELVKLKEENLFYRGLIDETEERLNKIQASVQEEEIHWRKQLQVKEDECQALKKEFAHQLKDKVGEIESIQEEKEKLEEECLLLRNRNVSQPARLDATATIEKLTEELDRLREQLQVEQAKNRDVNSCPKTLSNCNSTNGPSHLQRCLSTSSSNASSLHDVTIRKPKNKKKKKKESSKLED